MKLSNISLLLLRLAISYVWLTAGITKLLNGQFISTFPNTLENFSKNSPHAFYSNFLHTYVMSHANIFAQLVTWGEILTGVAFLIGFPIVIACISGIFMNINYYLVANTTPSQFLNIILIFSQLVAYTNGAGAIWGLSTKTNLKFKS
jgi:thiosulfate dehydrogenase [quinone] large subunit